MFDSLNQFPYLSGIISFVACLVITPLVIRLAYRNNWVVALRADRWHKRPTALMGGIGIFISFTIAIMLVSFKQMNWFILASCFTMFITGLVDDLKEIKPIVKLLGQIICSFVLIYEGYTFGSGILSWIGIPLTFFWVIGITNSINLLDNMDGLAAGISAIISIVSGVLASLSGDYQVAVLAFATGGAALGFLVYNFKPAKIFMGDCGSLFLGFSVSFFGLTIQKNIGSSSAIFILLVPISLMAIPIMDTTLVTIKRVVAGRRIDQGGKDHTSHRLVALGLSERKAVMLLYLICAVWGVLCIMTYKLETTVLMSILVVLSIFSVIFASVLANVKVYNESEEKLIYLRSRGKGPGNNFLLRFFLFNKKLIIGICTDILIISCSFFIAAKSTHLELGAEYFILGLFISGKILFFYFSNLYKRVWRYATVIELSSYFISSLVSTIFLVVILFCVDKLSLFTGYFFFVDFLITFMAVGFSRLTYRALREFIFRSREVKRKMIIYGAGDGGYLLIKELTHNSSYDLQPLGWIDDDESKHKMYINDLRIYGGEDKIESVCKKLNIAVVLISSSSISEEKEALLRARLEPLNVEVGRFSVGLYIKSRKE